MAEDKNYGYIIKSCPLILVRVCTGTLSQVSSQSVLTTESSQTPSNPHSVLIKNRPAPDIQEVTEVRLNVSSEIRHATIDLTV